jgi:hypothetical protein
LYTAYPDDCTNFVSQALYAGGHSFVADSGGPRSVVLSDDLQWWNYEGGAGRTFSWSVANDLWKFENVGIPGGPYGYGFLIGADPYYEYVSNNIWGGHAAWGAFIPTTDTAYAQPIDDDGYTLSVQPGDVMFYNWAFSGNQSDGDGFFGNHDAIAVVANGTDPNSQWTGPLVDEHNTDREYAIWNLLPYNSQWQTTAAWYDQPNPYIGTANLTQAQAREHRLPEMSGNTHASALSNGHAPEISTPSTPSAQLAYSGTQKVEGHLSASLASVSERAFQAAMITRQQVVVPPPSPISAPLGRQPAEANLDQMVASGDQRVSGLFTGTALQRELATMQSVRNGEAKSDVRVLGGGADQFHYSLVRRVSPAEIELRGTARTWSKLAQVQAGGRLVPATPHNTLDVDVTLTKSASGWKVSDLNWTFALGSQP